MNRSLLLLSAAVASLAFACSATSAEDTASSDDALNGSLATAKACAVKDAYAAAELAAFKTAAKTELPGVETGASSISKFEVTGIGSVFVVEEASAMSFYDAAGALLAKAGTESDQLTWTQRSGAPLSCATQAAPEPVSPAPTSCVATDPIDHTQFTYIPAAPAAAGKCSAQELATITSYYTQHAADISFDMAGWKASVSAGCGTCAFSDINDATWAPILVQDGQFAGVVEGGCIGAVSNNAECGRAYQQYQDCTMQACLVNCTTQEEYAACRQDQTVLGTACANAVNDVITQCGQDALPTYETACRGTTYTFEGPIKVMCVTGQ